MTTAVPARLQEAIGIIVDEVAECFAAEQILTGFHRHVDNLAALSKEIQQTWGFIEQAVSWKLALAVHRLLQPSGDDRASLLGLDREVRAARSSGFTVADPNQYAIALGELSRVRALPETDSLNTARNAFMAHALIGEGRIGAPLKEIYSLLDEIVAIVGTLHIAITGEQSALQFRCDQWIEWSDAWWATVINCE